MPRKLLLCLYAMIATTLIQPVMAADPPTEAIESRAMDILKRSTDHLAKAGRFSMVLAYSYDALQPSGQKIEFGGMRKALISRPGSARIEFSRRDGLKGTLLYDGKTATLYNDELKVYTQIQREGTIGEVMDFLPKRPGADLHL